MGAKLRQKKNMAKEYKEKSMNDVNSWLKSF